ncbi:restriction endonuclease subunit S [Aquabacterium commune]|nr:restriction endonuclease subunit S [Aquabacterium commune]
MDIALPGKDGLVDGPFGSNLPSSAYTQAGVPVIRGSNLTKGTERFKSDEFVYVSSETAGQLSRSLCLPNDIVFTKKGTLGQIGLVPFGRHSTYLLSSNQMRMRVDGACADPEFVYYYLAQRESIEKIIRDSEHTGVPKINLGYLKSFPISLPDVRTQRAIASVLSAFDERITVLRETNTTLEAIAQALFKSWFVDFDPVRAKLAGLAPKGMDEATAALFPEAFEDTELGAVPKGWGYSSVGESFVLTMGQSPPGDTYNDAAEGLAFYQGRTDFGFRFPTQRVFCVKPSRIAEVGDTLVSVRAPVGDVNMAIERCCIGRGVASVRHPKDYRGFAFYAMRSLGEQFKMFDSEGTVFGSINKKDFQALPVISPDDGVLRAYDELTSPIDRRVVKNEQQLRTLAILRDTLIPRLISGQLRLPEAQHQIEEAAA